MTDRNDNPFDSMDEEYPFEDFESETTASSNTSSTAPRQRARSGNKNFWIAIGVLALVFLVVVAVLIVIALNVLPKTQQARLEEAALINAHNTATSQAATDYALIQEQQAKVTETPLPTNTVEPSSTPVVVLATQTKEASPTKDEREIGGPVDDPGRTATVAALLTQAAGGGTVVATSAGGLTATALPQSGFVEDVGIPGLFGLAIALIVVIFLVRRLRTSGTA